MILLAIETSSIACSIALSVNDEIKSIHEIAPMQQAQKILPMIETLLRESALSLDQVDALVLGHGPGSFTGVRIATSVVQGLAFAKNIPVISISSLAALAQASFLTHGWKKLLVGVDARIQEVYWGQYTVNEQGLVELNGKETVCAPANVPLPLSSDWYGTGDAWDIYSKEIPYHPLEIDCKQMPTAVGLLHLAKAKYVKQEWTIAEEVLPIYLRDKVASKK